MARQGLSFNLLRSVAIAVTVLACPLQVQADAARNDWKSNIIDAAVDALDSEQDVSVAAVPLNGPGLSQFINADRTMSPGSIMKVITTFAALEQLGPAHHWETRFLTDGSLEGETLNGNLFVRFSGDPRLSQKRLWSTLSELRGMGIKQITGDLVLDGTVFQLPNGLAGFQDDGDNPYAPFLVEPSPYLTNFNLFHIQVRSDERGTTSWVTPAIDRIRVDNQVTSVEEGPCPARRRFDWDIRRHDGSVTVRIQGELPQGCRTRKYMSLLSPEQYTGELITSLWEDVGGQIEGIYRTGETPEEANLLAVNHSRDLVSTVRDINKWSNNVMARQLLLNIGANHREPEDQDDRLAGIRVIKQWLEGLDVDTRGLVIENGSGLSRKSRISARQGVKILEAAWQSPFGADLIASMPVIATDGTMARRLRDTALETKGRIKTGYLRGVRSIAGFSRDENDTTWAVVGMVNHSPAWNGQAFLDKVLYSLYHQPPKGTTISQAN